MAHTRSKRDSQQDKDILLQANPSLGDHQLVHNKRQ